MQVATLLRMLNLFKLINNILSVLLLNEAYSLGLPLLPQNYRSFSFRQGEVFAR